MTRLRYKDAEREPVQVDGDPLLSAYLRFDDLTLRMEESRVYPNGTPWYRVMNTDGSIRSHWFENNPQRCLDDYTDQLEALRVERAYNAAVRG